MDKNEGARRIMMTGKVIMLIGITLGAIVSLMMGILWGAMTALYPVAIGGAVWAAGWIVRGSVSALRELHAF